MIFKFVVICDPKWPLHAHQELRKQQRFPTPFSHPARPPAACRKALQRAASKDGSNGKYPTWADTRDGGRRVGWVLDQRSRADPPALTTLAAQFAIPNCGSVTTPHVLMRMDGALGSYVKRKGGRFS